MLWEGWERKGEIPCDDPVARLSKAIWTLFRWTIFRFLRKQNHIVPRPTIATNAIPPTTPPAIAPALDFELTVAAVVDGVNEVETLVLVAIVDEDDEASDDQGIQFPS